MISKKIYTREGKSIDVYLDSFERSHVNSICEGGRTLWKFIEMLNSNQARF